MKLTKALRLEFVEAVMDGLPIKHKWDANDARERLHKAHEKLISPEIITLDAKHPGLIPKSHSHYIQELCHMRDGYKVSFYIYTYRLDIPIPRDAIDKEVQLMQAWEKEQEKRQEYASQLLAVANTCTTVEALKKLLPELESYVPDDGTPKQLPVAIAATIGSLVKDGLKIPKA